ncbi:PrpF domain-containing protein [Haliea sp. E17]|uniref:PrpF domain-containing protein n=1 Tax=Haliea sp. E17 TaxID=3401576 RepID=UPI003AB06140
MKIPCVIVRGGTSKGIYLRGEDLPSNPSDRDSVICSIFGSPDSRQIDGLGGGDPLTSKVAILSARNLVEGSDVSYLSGEVRLGCSEINYGIMCGNLASGVGLAAFHLDLLKPEAIGNAIRIYNVNSGGIIHAIHDDFDAGVGGKNTSVKLTFLSSGGRATSKILPTHRPIEWLSINGLELEYSVVDAGAIYAFLKASQFGLSGSESVESLNGNRDLRSNVELVRRHVCDQINRLNPGLEIHTGQVKVALVKDLPGDSGFSNCDIEARIVNPQGVHHAYAVSGAICCCTASAIEGTIIQQLAPANSMNPRICIGHPEGLLEVSVELEDTNQGLSVCKASIERTARLIMKGMVYAA